MQRISDGTKTFNALLAAKHRAPVPLKYRQKATAEKPPGDCPGPPSHLPAAAGTRGPAGAVQVVDGSLWEVKVHDVVNPGREIEAPGCQVGAYHEVTRVRGLGVGTWGPG